MAIKPRPTKSAAALQHPIRVVPLHRPEAQRVAAAVAPRLTYRGGPLLTAVEVFTVFWGAEWQQAPQSALVTNLNLFFDFILTSALMDQLGEYSARSKYSRAGQFDSTTVAAGNRLQEPSGAWTQFTLFFLSSPRRAGCAGRQRFLPGFLRLSRLHHRQHLLCGHALPRLFRVRRRPYRRRRAHFHHLARTLRSGHRSPARSRMVRRQQR